MATRRYVRILITLDPLREVRLPVDEFTVDEEDGVQVFYDGILWGYFPAIEYVYVEEVDDGKPVTLTLPQEKPEIVLNGALDRPSYASFTAPDDEDDEDEDEDEGDDEEVEESDGTELPAR